MKKLLYLLTACFFLSGCGNNSTSTPNTKEKEIQLTNLTKIELAVNESYNVFSMIKEEYNEHVLSLEVSQKEIIAFDSDIGIIQGKQLGSTEITIHGNKCYQKLTVTVQSDEYMNAHFTLDRGRLFNKTATFYGDSITDQKNRPGYDIYHTGFGYYPSMLNEMAQMKQIYNLSQSGATAGTCTSIASIDPSYNFGFKQVQNSKKQNESADYAFIMFGTNDFMRCVPFGTLEDNHKTVEESTTFLGAYNYMYQTLLSYNPKIRIVAIEIPYSTWGQDAQYQVPGCGSSREEYSAKIREIVQKFGFISIPTYDLWNSSNWETYIPDGIHPAEVGQRTLAQRILSEI